MLNSPNWFIVVVIGALTGYFFNYIPKFIFYFFRFFSKEQMEGSWYEYHFNYENGEEKLRMEEWKISKGIYNKLSIKAKSLSYEKLSYHGTLCKERDYWIAKFVAEGHDEEVFCRLTAPIPSNDNIIHWLVVSCRFQWKASSGTTSSLT